MNDAHLNHDFAETDRAYQEMLKLFEDMSFGERMRRTFRGIGMPKDSGEYKFARLQFQRLSAPLFAAAGTLAVLIMLVASGTQPARRQPAVQAAVAEAEDKVEIADDPLPEPPEAESACIPPEVDVPGEPGVSLPDSALRPATNGSVSPDPASILAVINTKSPIAMKNLLGSDNPLGTRTGDKRDKNLGDNGGDQQTEDCVMRALRWFAWTQNRAFSKGVWSEATTDGSWGRNKTAMTGLVLLCFLAHGETPGSDEFGDTVQRGLQFLCDEQQPDGFFRYKDGNNYSHSMATYALCEAYTMTKSPIVKAAAEKAVAQIVKGQHPNGGWDYKYAQTERDDGSFSGWAAQAIKAAKMCGDLEVHGLDKAYELAPKCFMTKLYHKDGGFGYTGPQKGGLTSVGVLCCQLMGHANSAQVKKSLEVMDEWEVGFEKDDYKVPGNCPQYYFYYGTQCMFHAGGARWNRWNDRMKPRYVKAQRQMSADESGYRDHNGRGHAIGWWVNHDGHSDDGNADRPDLRLPVNDTAYATLQLEVYYRHLPTFMTPETVEVQAELDRSGDVPVDIVF